MCFSATGSFGVAAVLAGVGGVALARNQGRTRPLAFMPLLFAAQQAAEGMVWLTLTNGGPPLVQAAAINAFLAFALVIWPAWLPLALLRLEPEASPRRLLRALAAIGLLVAGIGAAVLIGLRPHARVAGHSIHYIYGLPGGSATHVPYLGLYALATLLPFFVVTLPLGRIIGAVLLVALATTAIARRAALTSVWCFFAAIISLLVVAALERAQRRPPAAVPSLA
jgi:hypothetical protein